MKINKENKKVFCSECKNFIWMTNEKYGCIIDKNKNVRLLIIYTIQISIQNKIKIMIVNFSKERNFQVYFKDKGLIKNES